MKVICPASNTILQLLKRFKRLDINYRLIKYVVQAKMDDGLLLFNLLTREMILLSDDEFADINNIPYLKDNFFIVPENVNEKEYADFVKLYLSLQVKKANNIVTYTVFPTTDCNARCFYCFELGRSRIPMSEEVALKVVSFIKKHSGNKKVKFRWFGGEPLLNYKAIDTICSGLRKERIDYVSGMVSNGFLFSDELVRKALVLWNLTKVQITLDGTEKVYNKVKAFIYKDTNPYEIVLNNIERLLNAGIKVTIRMNMDLHNADDLLLLANDLASRFSGRNGLYVYAHHLFKEGVPMAQIHTEEEWDERDRAMLKIEDVLKYNGLASRAGISKTINMHHCMADSGSAVTILPDGNVGLCEHHSESEFIGNLDSEQFDQSMISSWSERVAEIPECADCFYFPECIKLKKCSHACECYSQFRNELLRKTQQRMINEYEDWKADRTN